MARAKKEAALTPEERLQAALVPDWEWPYKLPGNWCWTKITVITDILNGFAFKSQHYSSAGIRIIRITNVQDGFIQDKKPVYYPLESQKEITPFMLKDGDFLMSLTGNVGRVAIIDASFLPAALNQRVACLRIKSEDSVRKEYIFYFCLQKQFVSDCIKSAKGSAQLNMSTEWLKEYPIPLPPLAEQQRIVDRIESLFAKLDEAKEKAQAVVDSFENRKAAILHKAFTGELTAKWREEHGVGMESWEKKRLSDVVTEFKYGTSEKSDYNNKGMPVLRIPNIGDNGINLSDIKYLNHRNVDSESQIHEGDILIIRSNGSRDLVGKAVLVPELGCEYAYASFLIRAKPNHSIINAHYLTIFLNSTDARGKMFRRAKSSAGINNINTKELGAISLTVPSLPEQDEIVHIINEMMEKDQQSKEAAEAALDQIDLMKKSILARAFRGELGTNDPSEESAVELLKQII